jgi:SAM-dependent methyltransferase
MHPSLIAQLIKQLPPSASQLKAWDIGGMLAAHLAAHRPDIDVQIVSVLASHWPEQQVDAVLGCDVYVNEALLQRALAALRPGGRLVIANPHQPFDTTWGPRLSRLGYVRLLLEPLDIGSGMLIRGERPHTQADTLARIQVVAAAEADELSLTAYRGRFVHLLVQQLPNKPPWKLTPQDRIIWQALCGGDRLLAFSSLPKAVAFMQAAVLANRLRDINKVAKFRREVAAEWPLLLNPSSEAFSSVAFTWREVDPTLAEAPDE